MTPPLHGDMRAGYTGLIVAAIFLGAVMYGIVQLTNQKFAGHSKAAPAAAQSH
ncbi:MAG TPA: hypothetical protein VJ672_13800 [Gemmatimonadaceae bacterium]|nr:hypothetical protein [Gemmatimonadaceae bacterium]